MSDLNREDARPAPPADQDGHARMAGAPGGERHLAPQERKGWRDYWDTLTARLRSSGVERDESVSRDLTDVVGARAAAGRSSARVTRTPTSAVTATHSRSAPAHPSEGPKPKVGEARRTRTARLRLSHLDPWSVMKTSFLFSIAGGIVLVVAVYAVWTVISSSGLFGNVNDIIASVVSTPGDATPFRVEDYINTSKVMGVTAFLAVIDILIITALATLGSFLYNLSALMLGGLEVTLAED